MFRWWLLMILLIIDFIQAGVLSEHHQPYRLCGTPQISAFDMETEMQKLKKEDPTVYEKWQEEIERVNLFNSKTTQQKLFWAFNFTTNQYYTVQATLRKSGAFTKIWVEDASWNTYVNDTILDELLTNLENYSGANSIDPSRGIVEIDTFLFGQPPNYDGDSITDFLILDIKDSFNPSNNNLSFIAGYFSPTDQTNNSTSNKMDLMYLDAYPAIFYQNTYRTDAVLSTTAHEFQHLIHYHYDKNEELWINEGLSELAGTYCGYGINFPNLYLQNTNQSLIQWDGEVKDYSRVNLWTLYCAEQIGLPFIKNLTQNPLHGVSGFNDSIIRSGSSIDINTVFSQWILANYINDQNLDPRLGYSWHEAVGLKAQMNKLIVSYPQNVEGNLEKYGVEYHQFRGQDSLQISFLSALPYNFWIVAKNPTYRINQLTASSFTDSQFSEDSTYVLILYGLSNDLSYRYNAFARYSLRYFEISYDDNQTNLSVNFSSVPAIAANRFIIPESNLDLEKIRFWSGSKDYVATIRILENRVNNFPGNDLIDPIQVDVKTENSWIDVDMTSSLTGLQKNQVIYAAVEVNNDTKRLGYDDQITPGISYLNINNTWRLLSDFVFSGNQPANGVWMIRAIFSGLALSDTSTQPNDNDKLVVYGAYPNILSAHEKGTTIQYSSISSQEIQFTVYNALGQKVAEKIEPATGSIYWNGYGRYGPLASGIYFFQLKYTHQESNRIVRSRFHKIFILN